MGTADESYDLVNGFGSTLDVFEDETTIPRRKKRRSSARRVSFAEIQTVHVFPRDEEYATPPGAALEVASPQPLRKSPRLAARKRSPMAEGQAEDTGSSTDKNAISYVETESGEEATGPVDINHIVQVNQGSPYLDDDITLDSTTFSAKLMKLTNETRAIEHRVKEDNVKLPGSWESDMSFTVQKPRRPLPFSTDSPSASLDRSLSMQYTEMVDAGTLAQRRRRVFRASPHLKEKENVSPPSSVNSVVPKKPRLETPIGGLKRRITYLSEGKENTPISASDKTETSKFPTLASLCDRDVTETSQTSKDITIIGEVPVLSSFRDGDNTESIVDSIVDRETTQETKDITGVPTLLSLLDRDTTTFDETPLPNCPEDSNSPAPTTQKIAGVVNISNTPGSTNQKMAAKVNISTPVPVKPEMAGEVNLSNTPVLTKEKITGEVHISNTPVPEKQKMAGEMNITNTPVSKKQKLAGEVNMSNTPVPTKQRMAWEMNNPVPTKQKMDGKLKVYCDNLKIKTDATKVLHEQLKKEAEAMKACHDMLKKLRSRSQQVQNSWADKHCLSGRNEEESSKKELARLRQGLQEMQDKNEQMRATMKLLNKRLQDLSVILADCKKEHSQLQLLQRMQGWHITRLVSERDAYWLDVSYGYRVNQSLTIQGLAPLSCAINITPNLHFIEKGFPRMNANLFFQALIPEGKCRIKQLKSLPVAMQQTSDFVMNLIHVAKEARDCRAQHRCLESVVFVNHKDHGICLQFQFVNYRMRLRITLLFSLQSLINGQYPADIIPCELFVDSTRRTQTVVTEQDLSNAICSLPVGYQRFHRTCVCIANFLP